MTQRVYRTFSILFAACLLVWLLLSWPATQDDAFIHLRYAANLLQHDLISYDGTHQDYGTSSLLYVCLLATLRALFQSPLLPRAVSSFFHLALFGGLIWAFPRALKAAPRLAWGFAVLLLAVLVSPMAVRWLDDGMETSLTLCLIALTAFATSRLCHSDRFSKRSIAWLCALGFIATLTRVEYLLLFGVVSVTLFFSRLSARGSFTARSVFSEPLRVVASCGEPLLGSLVAAAVIAFSMHSLMPDTAVAKAAGSARWLGTLSQTLSVLVSAGSVGILLLLLWLLTAAAAFAFARARWLVIAVPNSLFPLVLFLAAVRGQAVQGVRYFLWTLLFPILWNILDLSWSRQQPNESALRSLRLSMYVLAAMLICLLPVESIFLHREFVARERSLAQFQAQHLDQLSSLKVVAYDIGYIGYFTGSQVCDLAGLVNGRARAMLSYPQRVKLCSAEDPQYAFLSQSNIDGIKSSLDLSHWSICSEYNLANLRAADVHYLIASPAATPAVCAAAGNPPKPLAPLLHASNSHPSMP